MILDLFAGAKGVAAACRKLGVPAESYELNDGPEFDLSREQVVTNILKRMRQGQIRGIAMGTPCNLLRFQLLDIATHRYEVDVFSGGFPGSASVWLNK